MAYRRILAAAVAFSLTAAMSSCSRGEEIKNDSEITAETTEVTEAVTDEETTTEEELIPPVPSEATDPNTFTFDDDEFGFAKAQTGDIDSAQGELEIVEVMGNKMLCFKDSGTSAAEEKVQKIQFDAAQLLAPEDLPKVRSIQLDVYADATAEDFVNDDGENIKAPGWIGGGGGANVSGDKWYEFAEWEGGEYNFDMSGAVHINLKFLLAAGGLCWDEEMEEATVLIMRWGLKNEGNMYIDNIVFYDEDGNSIPLTVNIKSDEDESEATEETAEETELTEESE